MAFARATMREMNNYNKCCVKNTEDYLGIIIKKNSGERKMIFLTWVSEGYNLSDETKFVSS